MTVIHETPLWRHCGEVLKDPALPVRLEIDLLFLVLQQIEGDLSWCRPPKLFWKSGEVQWGLNLHEMQVLMWRLVLMRFVKFFKQISKTTYDCHKSEKNVRGSSPGKSVFFTIETTDGGIRLRPELSV